MSPENKKVELLERALAAAINREEPESHLYASFHLAEVKNAADIELPVTRVRIGHENIKSIGPFVPGPLDTRREGAVSVTVHLSAFVLRAFESRRVLVALSFAPSGAGDVLLCSPIEVQQIYFNESSTFEVDLNFHNVVLSKVDQPKWLTANQFDLFMNALEDRKKSTDVTESWLLELLEEANKQPEFTSRPRYFYKRDLVHLVALALRGLKEVGP